MDAYLLEADVIYNPANWRSQIGTQLWIASFNRGFEGWSAIRKYDFKTFAPAIGSGENIPNRIKYPQTEQNINNSNLNAAAAAMPGGDSKATKIFWDKN